jgi:hypothetical protein
VADGYGDPQPWLSTDRAIFIFACVFSALLLAGFVSREQQPEAPPQPAPPPLPRLPALAGAALLALLVAAQTATHVGGAAPYLYLTTPAFPNGPGSGADGYVYWLEGRPTYMESWQFLNQAAVYTGAQEDRTTGLADARAGYAYLLALLAGPLGYFWSATVLNALCWLVAALATWDLGRRLLRVEPVAFGAAVLVAAGQGFVNLTGTPMSYVAGFAWMPVLLAVAVRWELTSTRSSLLRWAVWGWLCGVAGLFYLTHIVVLGVLWLLSARRAMVGRLLLATAIAFAVPVTWELYGRAFVGLQFEAGTAADLSANVMGLLRTAVAAPLTLPAEAGRGTTRALLGGFPLPLLPLAALGVLTAPAPRRTWYLAVAVCGLGPAMILHHLPATQRYGYLAFPAVALAAAEGVWWLARLLPWLATASSGIAGAGRRADRPPAASAGRHEVAVRWATAGLVVVGVAALLQANADLRGIYDFALAFGGP